MRPPSAHSKLRRQTLPAAAILQSAADQGFNLVGLRKGLKAVIRFERGLDPGAQVDLTDLTVLAFAVACSPRLVYADWVVPLLRRMRSGESPQPSGAMPDDDQGAVKVWTRGRSVVAVQLPHRPPRRKTSKQAGKGSPSRPNQSGSSAEA